MRNIKDGISEAQGIFPRLEVGETNTHFNGQPPGRLPRVLDEKLVGAIVNIVDSVEVRFLILGKITSQQVGILIAVAVSIAGFDLYVSVGVVVRRLRVANPLIEEPALIV